MFTSEYINLIILIVVGLLIGAIAGLIALRSNRQNANWGWLYNVLVGLDVAILVWVLLFYGIIPWMNKQLARPESTNGSPTLTSEMVELKCGDKVFSLLPPTPPYVGYVCDEDGQPAYVSVAVATPLPTPTEWHQQEPTTTPTLTQTVPVQPLASWEYPLAGQTYVAWINGQPDQSDLYVAEWSASGWLHQPRLPEEGHRVGFVMSITIEEGPYTFNGVSCRLHLDPSRNGKGADNPRTVGYGNGLPFEVRTADHGQAWAFIVCDPTDVTGFSIQYKSP